MIKIGKYLREISVVVIGVAITLSVSFWITNKSEKKDLALYLNAIKMELEENAENFDFYAQWLKKSVRYANYLNSNDKKSLNKDSLSYYSFTDDAGCGYMNTNSITSQLFMTNAFEMFKNSGAMRKITDKELLMSIWRTYTYLEYAVGVFDRSFLIKQEEAMREQELIANEIPIAVPMRIYYSTDLPYSLVRHSETTSAIIKETIAKLEGSKMLK
jgi:hypothetical protein